MAYIKFNLIEGDSAQSIRSSCINGLDVEVHAVCLSKDKEDSELGLSFGNIPIFGDPDRRKNGVPRRRREQGPVIDVGCIWVTEVRKRSPAACSGKIKLRDEILSLNGQLMVGVDVTGARLVHRSICTVMLKVQCVKFCPRVVAFYNATHFRSQACSELQWLVHTTLNKSSTFFITGSFDPNPSLYT